MRSRILATALAAGLATAGLAAPAPKAADRPPGDGHAFVFFGARPVLLRLHVQIDGKPSTRAYDDFIDHVFRYLDTNKDGKLSKEELDHLPPPQVLFNSGGFFNLGGRRARGQRPGRPDRMTRADLADYFRRNGASPFQLTYSGANANLQGDIVFVGGGFGGPAPTAEQFNEALFKHLDTNRDGKLSHAELAAAPAVLAKLDEDEDETIAMEELIPGSGGNAGVFAAPVLIDRAGSMRQPDTGPFLALGPGESSRLARELLTRYGKNKKKLTRTDLGLDRETFAALDTNGDGALDSEELSHFADRTADLELLVRFGQRRPKQAPVELMHPGGKPTALAARTRLAADGALHIDLGNTRLEMRLSGSAVGNNGAFLRQQYIAQFKQADRDNNGYLDAKEAMASPFFQNTFKLMDRDGDGKLFEKEMLAYVDSMLDLQVRAVAAVLSVNAADEGKGLFDLIDTNHDGRLSVRELRQAVKLVDQLDRDGDGAISRDEIPKNFRLTVQRGPANGGFSRPGVVFVNGRRTGNRPAAPTAGPLWFRKMDRNHDGDVSRKEFLGTDEEFKRIDTDGDGLISAEEAERYDALLRKEKGPGH
jgi:Ca2+-binding EF-hand superfamily protein